MVMTISAQNLYHDTGSRFCSLTCERPKTDCDYSTTGGLLSHMGTKGVYDAVLPAKKPREKHRDGRVPAASPAPPTGLMFVCGPNIVRSGGASLPILSMPKVESTHAPTKVAAEDVPKAHVEPSAFPRIQRAQPNPHDQHPHEPSPEGRKPRASAGAAEVPMNWKEGLRPEPKGAPSAEAARLASFAAGSASEAYARLKAAKQEEWGREDRLAADKRAALAEAARAAAEAKAEAARQKQQAEVSMTLAAAPLALVHMIQPNGRESAHQTLISCPPIPSLGQGCTGAHVGG